MESSLTNKAMKTHIKLSNVSIDDNQVNSKLNYFVVN